MIINLFDRLVDIETPKLVEMDSIEKCTHYTFFDSTGRLAITFTRRNVVMDHELPIFVNFTNPGFFIKPSFLTLLLDQV